MINSDNMYTTNNTDMKFCHECGMELSPSDKFCQFCGAEQRTIAEEQYTQNKQNTTAQYEQPQPKSKVPNLSEEITQSITIGIDKLKEGIKKGVEKIRIEVEKSNQKIKEETKKVKKTIKKPRAPLKRGDLIAEGIMGMIWGLILISVATSTFHSFLGATALEWIRVCGMFALYGATIRGIQALIGVKNINTQRFLIIVHAYISLVFIPHILLLPEIVNTVPEFIALDAETIQTVMTGLSYLPLITTISAIITVIATFVQVVELRSKYNTYKRKLEEYNNQYAY